MYYLICRHKKGFSVISEDSDLNKLQIKADINNNRHNIDRYYKVVGWGEMIHMNNYKAKNECGLGIPELKPKSKYHKIIKGNQVDVYDISNAYKLSHARGHALKKLLMAGDRGHKDTIQDLKECIATIEREIENLESK